MIPRGHGLFDSVGDLWVGMVLVMESGSELFGQKDTSYERVVCVLWSSPHVESEEVTFISIELEPIICCVEFYFLEDALGRRACHEGEESVVCVYNFVVEMVVLEYGVLDVSMGSEPKFVVDVVP